MAIKKFPSNPTDIMYIAMPILQKWRPLLKEKDQAKVPDVNDRIIRWLKDFDPASTLLTDVYEI